MPELSDFPRPNVAVDLAVLTVRPTPDTPELVGLVQHRTEAPQGAVLPGRFIRERETIQDTVAAILEVKVGLPPSVTGRRGLQPRLLRVFDDPHRDERGWAISIGHALALPWEVAMLAGGEWRPVTRSGGLRGTRLLFDHAAILREAVDGMRDRYEVDPDPDHLLVGEFTLLDLRQVHEAVLGERVRKDTFARRMREALEPTGGQSTVLSLSPSTSFVSMDMARDSSTPAPLRNVRPGRPAKLYRHARQPRKLSDSLWRLPRE